MVRDCCTYTKIRMSGVVMMLLRRRFHFFVCLIVVVLPCLAEALQPSACQQMGSSHETMRQHVFAHDEVSATDDSLEDGTKPCFYRSPEGGWKQRLNILDLKVGQTLNGVVVQELLAAKTGPKLFFDCGVGRIDSNGDWQIVNGMLRFLKKGTKPSVVRKKALKLKKNAPVQLYVSRVLADSCQFEVCTSLEDVELYQKMQKKVISASSLKPQQELVGTVVKVLPFGVFVDVGANRNGLLHISKVADLYGRYIDKKNGLEEAGLESGAKIRVAVLSNERKRLALDFTSDVKEEAAKEQMEERKAKLKGEDKIALEENEVAQEVSAPEPDPYDISEEEAAMWAAYEDAEEDDYDDTDEDRDIEDAFGLGTY